MLHCVHFFSFPTHPHLIYCYFSSSKVVSIIILFICFTLCFHNWVRELKAASGHSSRANFVAFDSICFTTHFAFQHLWPGIRHFAFGSAGITRLRRYDHHLRASCTFFFCPPLVIFSPKGDSVTISDFKLLLCRGDQKIDHHQESNKLIPASEKEN